MEHGSLTNMMMSNSKPEVPKVGDGATILSWTDRRACTVIEVSASGKTIKIQEDTSTRTDKLGMSECQDYTYTPDPNGSIHEVRLGKKGWKVVKGNRVLIGSRETYHDYSF